MIYINLNEKTYSEQIEHVKDLLPCNKLELNIGSFSDVIPKLVRDYGDSCVITIFYDPEINSAQQLEELKRITRLQHHPISVQFKIWELRKVD